MAKAGAAKAEFQQTLPADHQTALHLVSQVKGGIGKSVVSSWLAQYLEHAGRKAACYDADPGNKTFSRISSLQVRPLDLVVDGEICASAYDFLIEACKILVLLWLTRVPAVLSLFGTMSLRTTCFRFWRNMARRAWFMFRWPQFLI